MAKDSQLSPPPRVELVGAEGSPLQVFGGASVTLVLNGVSMPLDVMIVSPLTSEGILGLDFLKDQGATIDLNSEQISLRKHDIAISMRKPTAAPNRRVGVRALDQRSTAS